MKELKTTLRFVFFIATPLSLVNSCLANWNAADFLLAWTGGFLWIYPISFLQAVSYVSAIKWYDRRKSTQKQRVKN